MVKQKSRIANQIVVFFKTLKISTIIAVLAFAVMYFGVYKAHECFNPDVYELKMRIGRDFNHVLSYDDIVPHEDRNNVIVYGNRFLMDLRDYYNMRVPGWYSVLFDETEDCCRWWLRDRAIHSGLVAVAILFGIPLIVITIRFSVHSIKGAKSWVDENRTM